MINKKDLSSIHVASGQIAIINGEWHCVCGNDPSREGFHPCNEAGVIDEDADAGTAKLFACGNCGLIIESANGDIVPPEIPQQPEKPKRATAGELSLALMEYRGDALLNVCLDGQDINPVALVGINTHPDYPTKNEISLELKELTGAPIDEPNLIPEDSLVIDYANAEAALMAAIKALQNNLGLPVVEGAEAFMLADHIERLTKMRDQCNMLRKSAFTRAKTAGSRAPDFRDMATVANIMSR
jgi:hypothetical protein